MYIRSYVSNKFAVKLFTAGPVFLKVLSYKIYECIFKHKNLSGSILKSIICDTFVNRNYPLYSYIYIVTIMHGVDGVSIILGYSNFSEINDRCFQPISSIIGIK